MNLFAPHEIAVLSKGYGGRLKGPVRVDQCIHKAKDVGDEALLLTQVAPTWIACNRYHGAKAAQSYGAKVIIMDDGLQNYQLHQDCRLLVIDSHYGFGNGFVFPAGPLREPLIAGISKADAFIIIGDADNILKKYADYKPKFTARSISRVDLSHDQPVIAFAGIGYPQKFHNALLSARLNVIEFKNFPDHYMYTNDDLIMLLQQAQQHQAQLVTTAKDYIRLPEDFKCHVQVCHQTLVFDHDDNFINFLQLHFKS